MGWSIVHTKSGKYLNPIYATQLDINQDLRHTGPSTFFRGIEAVLGFTPPGGSLIGKRNKNNFRFDHQHTKDISEWIDAHLFVKRQTLDEYDLRVWESRAVGTYHPLFNSQGNPQALQGLAALRKKRRDVALADNPPDPYLIHWRKWKKFKPALTEPRTPMTLTPCFILRDEHIATTSKFGRSYVAFCN